MLWTMSLTLELIVKGKAVGDIVQQSLLCYFKDTHKTTHRTKTGSSYLLWTV